MKKLSVRFVTYTGLMTAIVYVCTLIGVSTPVANFNIGDSAILICAALFDPLVAMIAGGLGAFLADLTTYPATMLYTLIIKAIEGLVAGIAFKLIYKNYNSVAKPTKYDDALKIVFATLNCIVCTLFMAGGYFICKWFFYGTFSSALSSLPKNIIQALVSTLIAMLVLYAAKLEKQRPKTQLVSSIQDIRQKEYRRLDDGEEESADVDDNSQDVTETQSSCEEQVEQQPSVAENNDNVEAQTNAEESDNDSALGDVEDNA